MTETVKFENDQMQHKSILQNAQFSIIHNYMISEELLFSENVSNDDRIVILGDLSL